MTVLLTRTIALVQVPSTVECKKEEKEKEGRGEKRWQWSRAEERKEVSGGGAIAAARQW